MKHLNYTIIILLISLPLMAAQVPDDTAPAMKVKSRKLVFKADPKGLDWAARMQNLSTKLLDIVKGCFDRRPGISTLFHFLNHALILRDVNVNILLEQEGSCPKWLAEKVENALEICRKVTYKIGD